MPYLTGIAGSGTGQYLTDETGAPYLLRGDTIWGLPIMAGSAGGSATWQSDIDTYCATRAAQGFNAMYIAAVGTTNYSLSATNVNGDTWDSVSPFVGGDPGVLNDTYWQRVDYIVAAARAAGMTVLMNIAASYANNNAGGPLNGKTGTQWTNYGTALGNRYKAASNVTWFLGDDYFDDSNTNYGNAVAAIKATGDTHLFTYENYPESTSREDMKTPSNKLAGGTANANFSFAYSYNVSYLGIEDAWTEASPIPPIRGDGFYDNDSVGQAFNRGLLWWALSSGARGFIYGREAIWSWPPTALAALTTNPVDNTDFNNICNAFATLMDWNKLVPDTASALVTAGRGTHAAEFVSGGSGGSYSSGNTYVTASKTPSGSLAVIYIPNAAAAITVNGALMAAGYGAKWMDPVTGATTSATIGATYTHAGANSAGGADWVLILASPPYATWTAP